MEQIRYLKKEEKLNTRQMYEAIFEEDSKEFVDYYYRRKITDNQIIVMEDPKGYEVMLHLNPYQMMVNEKEVTVPYIVAVATRPDSRRKGKMFQVMQQALKELQKIHCPFTFLLPADSAYYRGQGFVFAEEIESISETEPAEKTGKQKGVPEWTYVSLSNTDKKQLQQAAEAANTMLAEQYDVYVKRDSAYFERLIEETASEQGNVLGIKVEEQIIGTLAYGGRESVEIKEFLLLKKYAEKRTEICDRIFGTDGWKEEKMQMMFRITDLQSLSGMLKGTKEIFNVAVTDKIVTENNGIWRMEWNPKGGSVIRITEEKAVQQHLDISEITEKIVKKMSVFIQEWV